MRNYVAKCTLMAMIASCTAPPATSSETSAITSTSPDANGPALTFEAYDAYGVSVVFFRTVTCSDIEQQCSGLVQMSMTSPDGATRFNVTQDNDYLITHADVNGVPLAGLTLDDVRVSAATVGLPIDGILDTVNMFFMAKEKTLKEKIQCVMKALGLGGKLTMTTFSCSFCFATIMGAELGPPDWLAGIATCSACAKLTGKSIKGLFDLIKTCKDGQMAAAELGSGAETVVVSTDTGTTSGSGAIVTDISTSGTTSGSGAIVTDTSTSGTTSGSGAIVTDTSTGTTEGSGAGSGGTTATDDEGEGDGWIVEGSAGSGSGSGEELSDNAGAKSGDVLYSVYWYGKGVTTIVADYYFYREMSKLAEACKQAGGELKNMKVETYGIGWYKNEGWADCVKK
jgi:hypothetical protein